LNSLQADDFEAEIFYICFEVLSSKDCLLLKVLRQSQPQ